MIYSFKCDQGHQEQIVRSVHVGPPSVDFSCKVCGWKMHRDWQADAPMLNTSACRDQSEIKADKRVRSAWDGGKSPDRVENEFKRHIEQRRSQIKDAGGQRGSIKQTHAVPSHLYHGKIKETGDKNYWSDPKNLNRHSECKVE